MKEDKKTFPTTYFSFSLLLFSLFFLLLLPFWKEELSFVHTSRLKRLRLDKDDCKENLHRMRI